MDTKDQVLAAVRARAEALVRQDAAALEGLMHPECRWTSHAGLVMGRDEYIRRNTTAVNFTHQALEAPVVVVAGDTAVVTGTIVDRLDDGQEFRLLITMTWVHPREAWVLLAGHAGPRQ